MHANDFPSVYITQSELKSLSDNEMISDVVINVAQKMMTKRHPLAKSSPRSNTWPNYVFWTLPIATFTMVSHIG